MHDRFHTLRCLHPFCSALRSWAGTFRHRCLSQAHQNDLKPGSSFLNLYRSMIGKVE